MHALVRKTRILLPHKRKKYLGLCFCMMMYHSVLLPFWDQRLTSYVEYSSRCSFNCT